MAQHKPQVLMLATDWPDASKATTETLTINQSLAKDLSARGAEVFCTVPHFHHELTKNYESKLVHAKNCGVKLIGAVYRQGRREVPDRAWITDYWRQYYHDDVRYKGHNGTFTHIIAFVPDTYHSALDIALEYKEDHGELKVVLIITDTDHNKYSLTDEDILKADIVYTLGPKLLSDYHRINMGPNKKLNKLMPVRRGEGLVASDAVEASNPLLDKTDDIRIVTVWPAYTSTLAERDMSGLDIVAKAINGYSKYRQVTYGQKVRWEIRGVPDELQNEVRHIVMTTVENNDVIDVNTLRDVPVANNYTLYVSALRNHPCDVYCLQAMQHGVPALMYGQSGLGEYLKKKDGVGNQLVGHFVVDCRERNDLSKWSAAFDRIANIEGEEVKQFVENARRLAEALSKEPDPHWQGLVSSIVTDAAVCNLGTSYAPFENPGTEFQPHALSAAAHSGPGENAWSHAPSTNQRSMNPAVLDDQDKAFNNFSLKSQAAVQETTDVPVISRSWDDIFSERSLALLASKLTKEMDMFGKCLGLKQHDIDRFISDHPHNMGAAVSAMLVHYKNSSRLYKTREQSIEFVKALVDVNRRDLVEEVAGPQPRLPMPTPAVPHVIRDTTDLTRRRVKLWSDDDRYRQLLKSPGVYKSKESRPHGFAVVVNIKHVPGINPRDGSEVDVEMIKNVFNQLHYKVLLLQDLSSQDLMRELKGIANRKEELNSHDSIFVFLMSHGLKDKIYCSDYKTIELKNIFKIFDEDCPALRDKPKFFVIQACRNDTQGMNQENSLATDGFEPGQGWRYTLPDTKYDTFFAFSTVDGTKSFRDTKCGSWFIKAVAENFCEYAQTDHVQGIFTKVNSQIRQMTQTTTQMTRDERTNRWHYPEQCSEVQTRLTKDFYLFPGKL